MNVEQKLLLRVEDVKELTGFSRSFIYELISRGELRAIHIGRTMRITKDDLLAWIKQQKP